MRHLGKMQAALAIVFVLGFFAVLLVMLGKPDMRDAMLIMIGALAGSVATIVGFYFGSSSGSARKDELMAAANVRSTPGVQP